MTDEQMKIDKVFVEIRFDNVPYEIADDIVGGILQRVNTVAAERGRFPGKISVVIFDKDGNAIEGHES